jgi:DNA polymerase III subunit gamma/tau
LSKALYQKYRSQTFDELIGQEHISKILKNAVKQSNYSHAYLFIGSRGTGKTSTARILAKAINCEKPTIEGNPCNICNNCKSITSGSFLDLIEIDAASNRGIDQIRALKERIEFTPTDGKFKIYIIDEVHMLTNEAFNALLKTLEEPPAHVIFMLATTEAHKVPATIVSRCQRYDFRLGSDEEIKKVVIKSAKFEDVKLANDAVKLLVQNARGSYRDALSLLDVVIAGQLEGEHPGEVTADEVRMVLGLPDTTMVYYFLEKLVYGDGEAALKLVDELDSKGVNLQHFVRSTIEVLRQILVKHIQKKIKSTEYSFAYELDKNQILFLLNLFITADKGLKNAAIPVLVLEMLIPQIDFNVSHSNNVGAKNVTPESNSPNGNPVNNVDLSVKNVNVSQKVSKSEDEVDGKIGKNNSEKDSVAINVTAHVTVSKSEKASIETEKSLDQESSDKDNIAEKTEEVSKTTELAEDINSAKVSQKKSVEKEGPADEYSDVKLTIEDVKKDWNDVIRQIKEANGHLFAFLQAANIKSFEEGVLLLQVAFEFHKERIEAMKSREAILEVFEKVYGCKFMYKCEVNTQVKVRKQVGPEIILSQNAIESNPVKVQVNAQDATAPESKVSGSTTESANSDGKSVPGNANSGQSSSSSNASSDGKEEKKKFVFRKGLGKEVEELFAGL